MRPRDLVLGTITLTSFAISALPLGVAGQSLWDVPTYQRIVTLEISKPVLDFGDYSLPSSGTFLSVKWPLTDGLRFVGEVPMGYADFDGASDGETGLVLGNPYVGLNMGREDSNLSWQLGLRLPLAPADKDASRWIGTLSDYISRQGAFWGEMVTVVGTSTYRHRTENGFVALATGGVDVWVPTESGLDTEVFGLYGGQAGYETETWSALGGIMGRAYLSGDGGNIGDRTMHQLGAQVGYEMASVRPSLFFRLPLDEDMRDGLDYVIGLGIRVGF